MLSPEFPGADLPELGRGFGKVVPLPVHKVSRGNDEVRRRRPDLQEKVELKTAVDQEKTQQKQPHVKFPLWIRIESFAQSGNLIPQVRIDAALKEWVAQHRQSSERQGLIFFGVAAIFSFHQ